MTLLVAYFAAGAVIAGVMTLGFKAGMGRGHRLTLDQRLRVLVSVPLWPISLASTVFVLTGKPHLSSRLERIVFDWWINPLCIWWYLHKLDVPPTTEPAARRPRD